MKFKNTTRKWLSSLTTLSLLLLFNSAFAGTADRAYLLGDDTDVNNNSINDEGTVVAGIIIGSGAGNEDTLGRSFDSAGDASNLTTFSNIAPSGDPRYIDVGSTGLARPGAPSGAFGADFDGSGDYLSVLGLGNPVQGDDAYHDTINYRGLFTRIIQGWVRPTSPSAANGRQRIVQDTQQFGIFIQADSAGNNFWGFNYDVEDVTSNIPVNFDEWTHVAHMVDIGLGGFLLINGEVVADSGGFYSPNGGDDGSQQFALGATLSGSVGSFVVEDLFTGQLDDFEVRVVGNNTGVTPQGSEGPGMDFGQFDLGVDNQFVGNLNLTPGDTNGDNLVNGDGSGDPSTDDVAFFIEQFGNVQSFGVDQLVLGDLNSRTQNADLNVDGVTDINDWFILYQNHEDSASLASLSTLLAAASVPEPSSFFLLSMAGGLMVLRRRN